MPRKDLAQTSFFTPEFADPSCLEVGGLPWLFRTYDRELFPEWLFALWSGGTRRGRPGWPASVLLVALLLASAEGGMKRRQLVRRLKRDTAWRAACGLEIGGRTPGESTFRRFERYLQRRDPSSGIPRYLLLHEHFVRLCTEEGVVGTEATWVTDSTPMWCFGAIRDTVRLMGDGLRSLGRKWSRATGESLEALALRWELPLLLAKSTKGGLDIDWRNATARAEVVDSLAQAVLRIVKEVRERLGTVPPKEHKRLLRHCRHLLRVISSDLEADEQGRLVVAQKVAADRLVSLTDPRARHGRKTKSQTFNGFKIHLLGDTVSGLIASLSVTSGNVGDAAPAHRVIRRAKFLYAEISQVLADTAYGGAELRQTVRQEGVDILAPPQPVAERPDRFGLADFTIDLEQYVATCPAGVVVDLRNGRNERRYFRWPKASCDTCPLRGACLSASVTSKLVTLHPQYEELASIRERWARPETRLEYRKRSPGERLVSRIIAHGCRQARGFGLQSATLQCYVGAMSNNLALLARVLAEREKERQRMAA